MNKTGWKTEEIVNALVQDLDKTWRQVDKDKGYYFSDRSWPFVMFNLKITECFGHLIKMTEGDLLISKTYLMQRYLSVLNYVVHIHLSADWDYGDVHGKVGWGGGPLDGATTKRMFVAADIFWNELPEQLRNDIIRIINWHSEKYKDGPGKNFTVQPFQINAEKEGWNAIILALAYILSQDIQKSEIYKTAMLRHLYNITSIPGDLENNRIADGRRLSEWVLDARLTEGYLFRHHGIMHPLYMTEVLNSKKYVEKILADHHLESFAAVNAGMEEVATALRRFLLWNGRLAYPCGSDRRPRFSIENEDFYEAIFLNESEDLREKLRTRFYKYYKKPNINLVLSRYMKARDRLLVDFSQKPPEYKRQIFEKIIKTLENAINALKSKRTKGFSMRTIADNLDVDQAFQGIHGTFYDRDASLILQRDRNRFCSWSWKAFTDRTLPYNHEKQKHPYELVSATGLMIPRGAEDMGVWNENLIGMFKIKDHYSSRQAAWCKITQYPDGFATIGELLWCQRNPDDQPAVFQRIACVVLPDSHTMLIFNFVQANRDITLQRAEGLCLKIANDELNGNRRNIKYKEGEFSIEGLGGKDRILPIPGNWILIDNRLGFAKVCGQEKIVILDNSESNDLFHLPFGGAGPESLYESISYPYLSGDKKFKKQDIILDTINILYANVDIDQMESMLNQSQLKSTISGLKISRFRL